MADAPPGFDELPPGFADDDNVQTVAADAVDPELLERRRAWLKLNKQRHGVREAYTKASTKAPLPPEYLRKIIRDHGDMTDPKFRDHRRLYIGALRFMPHAILKLIENIPMPWEQAKYVDVVYHTAGAITIVNETPKVVEALFTAQAAATWTALRREKRARGPSFRRIDTKNIAFGDNEKPLDYASHVADLNPPGAVTLELDEDEDAAVLEWFYDTRDAPEGILLRPSRPRFKLSIAAMGTLLRLATPLLPEQRDRFLWSLRDFFTAKALNVALPGAPKFQMPNNELDAKAAANDEEWTDFTDLGKVIVRQPFNTETQLAHPWLYSADVEGVRLRRHRDGHVPVVVPTEGRHDAAVFHYSAAFNPIRDVQGAPVAEGDTFDDDLDGFSVPDGFQPFASDVSLEPADGNTSALRQGIDLLFAPAPFNRLDGPLRRPVDVPLVDAFYKNRAPADAAGKTKTSYQRMLKGFVKREIRKDKTARGVAQAAALARQEDDADANVAAPTATAADDDEKPTPLRKNRGPATTRVLDELAETKFFQKTNVEWLEAGMQLVHQGHTMLSLLLRMRNFTSMVHLDYNFTIMPTKTLSTKERKKTRLGQSFHLIRELLKLTKLVVDVHVKYRLGKVDGYELADALHYVFTHLAKVTGIYRYKYRAMRQVQQARDLKHLIHARFNTGEVTKGPGAGFWLPSWRVWMLFMRGMAPLLQTYLGNHLARLFEGRKNKGEAKRLTKQRVDSNFDLNLKAALKQALIEALPEGMRAGNKARVLESHASEAFRCWRANIPWVVKNMPPAIENLIRKFVKEKADHYVRQTYYNRERIVKGDVVDKGLYMKNLGRITRLKLRDEQDRQAAYLKNGPQFSAQEAVGIYKMMARWLESRNFTKIEFPKSGLRNEKELLAKSLDRLRQQHNVANRLTQDQREEQKRIEDAFDAPQEALNKIRHSLAKTRIFKPVKVEFMDGYSLLAPVYNVDPAEKMTDAFLDSYLWYEASRKGLFPNWVKPADTEPPPLLAYQFALAVSNSPHVWETAAGESTVMMQAAIEDLHAKVDWGVMKSVLGLILDPILVSYITTRHDVKLDYKDMSYEHHVGLIRGYQFASFLAQFWGLVCDLLLLGPERAAQLAGPPGRPVALGSFADPAEATAHPIRAYLRYSDRIYILLRYTRDEQEDLIDRFFDADRDPANLSVAGFKNKTCWPRDGRMRLFRHDVNLARAVFWDFRTRLPPAMGSISWDTGFVSVYSDVNPNLLFDLCGFEIRIVPSARTAGNGQGSDAPNVWPLRDKDTREIAARAFVQVTQEHVTRIRNKIRRCILSIGNSPFHKIAIRWNAVLMEIVPYYREAILGTEGLQQVLQKGETRVQTRIKMSINSKNPQRFPPVVFYSPPELGGLGMLSVGASLIPAADMKMAKLTSDAPVQHFVKGMSHADGDIPVPNVINSYPAWSREFVDSGRAWEEYRARYQDAKLANRRLSYDEVEDLLDLGIPRVRTLFSKDRRVLEHDRGWRVRQEFMQYQFGRFMSRWWYSEEHDGRLCAPLDDYKQTMIQALGGVEKVLEHTLFAGTGFTSWEGLFWDKKSNFEDRIKDEKLTKAMRIGLTKVPNQRFALWWSPTINREAVYGKESQLDLTGIMMTGKLELIKAMYIKVFSGHLWEKVHRSVVESLFRLLSAPEYIDLMHILEPRLQQIHAKKSLDRTHSEPDILLHAAARWPVAKPSQLEHDGDHFDQHNTTSTFWIDIQLKWGNYDKHNMPQYCRERYMEVMRQSAQRYPNPTGVVIAIDLAYNACGAYGYWIPELKPFLQRTMAKVMRFDPTLQVLRSRIQKELQLFKSDPTEQHLSTQNWAELFGAQTTWFVDDSTVNSVASQKTTAGNRVAASKNGALVILNPKTGQMLLSVIHKSALQGQARRSKLGMEKAAEEVASWLRSLPHEEQPHKIILTRRKLYGVLNSTLLDFQNVAIGKSDLILPVKYLLLHPRLLELVTTAPESKAVKFNVFDDWGMTLSPETCFRRLILILRGLHVNADRARFILQPDRQVMVEPHHFWPTYTIDEWKDVERQLHDMILADYARRNSIQVSQLTQQEVRDIMLGKEISSAEVQQDEAREIEEKAKKVVAGGVDVTTVNKRGETITVRQTKTFEIGAFTNSTTWRVRAAAGASLGLRVQNIFAGDAASSLGDDADVLVFPTTVLQRFLRCCDVATSIVAVCYGMAVPDYQQAREVRCLLMPPQQGKMGSATFPTALPDHALLKSQGLTPIGVIRTQGGGEPIATTADLCMLGALLADNESLNAETFSIVNVAVGNADCTVNAASLSDAGVAWAMEHRSAPVSTTPAPADAEHVAAAKVVVSSRVEGFVLVPSQGSWNYHFRPPSWSKNYEVRPDVPLEFYNAKHRPLHFTNFVRTMNAEEAAVGADDHESPFA